jgi:RNA polymerase sigma-70 factor (ECF subfamily)
VTVSRFAHVCVSTSMNRQLELQLVGRLRAADPDAFDAVHNAFNARLYNFLFRLSNRRDVAEDLLEETWLRLVTHAQHLRPDTVLGPWLFTVARHLHASYRRARLLEDSHSEGLISLWPCASPGPTPFESVEASEAQQRIATALASLPATYREALWLVAVEGLRPCEAAEVCGVAAEAMRQRLSRARALLARRLTDAERPGLVSLNEVPT